MTRTDAELAADQESGLVEFAPEPLDEESPEAPLLDLNTPLEDGKVYPVEISLVRLATTFRPFVLVVTNDDGELMELVTQGFDPEEAAAILTATVEQLNEPGALVERLDYDV